MHGATLGDEIVRYILLEIGGVRSVRAGDHDTFARVVIDFQERATPAFALSNEGSVLRVAIGPEGQAVPSARPAIPGKKAENVLPAKEILAFPAAGSDRISVINDNEAVLTKDSAASELILLAASEEITIKGETAAIPAIETAGRDPKWGIDGRLAVKYSRDLKNDNEFENPNDVRGLFEGAVKYTFSPQNFFKAGVRYRYIQEWGGRGFRLLEGPAGRDLPQPCRGKCFSGDRHPDNPLGKNR
ncbi:hypothetical protein ACFL2P_02250 [Candidatus Moduliflexota bacterium]